MFLWVCPRCKRLNATMVREVDFGRPPIGIRIRRVVLQDRCHHCGNTVASFTAGLVVKDEA